MKCMTAITALGLLVGGGHRPAPECGKHVELLSAKEVAAEMGATEAWVVRNFKVNLWSKTTPEGKGTKIGQMLPGSRAVILDEREADFLVRSPFDASEGWVGKIQVKKTLYQDTETMEPCTPREVAADEKAYTT